MPNYIHKCPKCESVTVVRYALDVETIERLDAIESLLESIADHIGLPEGPEPEVAEESST